MNPDWPIALVGYVVGLVTGASAALHFVGFWRERRRWLDSDRKWETLLYIVSLRDAGERSLKD